MNNTLTRKALIPKSNNIELNNPPLVNNKRNIWMKTQIIRHIVMPYNQLITVCVNKNL